MTGRLELIKLFGIWYAYFWVGVELLAFMLWRSLGPFHYDCPWGTFGIVLLICIFYATYGG